MEFGRKLCVNHIHSYYGFHTHPVSSKWYPSGEDLCDVSINSPRRKIPLIQSFIFNKFGYWKITLLTEKTENYFEKKEISEFINSREVSGVLYNVGRGRELPSKRIINDYINRVVLVLPNIDLVFVRL